MTTSRKPGQPLTPAQTLLVLLFIAVAALVGYFELAGPVARWDGSLTAGLPEGAMPTQRLLHGLAQALPLLLLAAMLCLTLASFRQPGQGRGGALRGAIGLILLLIAGIATHQAIFRWIFLPAVASGQFDEAQLVGARTAPGDPAPHFAVTTIDGQTVQAADLRGKVLLINFFSISSAACDQQLAQWQDLWNQFHADSRLRMLAIGRGESVEAVRAFAAEKGFAFVLTADPDRGIRSFCLRGGPAGLSDLARGQNRFSIPRLPRRADRRAGANATGGARQAGLRIGPNTRSGRGDGFAECVRLDTQRPGILALGAARRSGGRRT